MYIYAYILHKYALTDDGKQPDTTKPPQIKYSK